MKFVKVELKTQRTTPIIFTNNSIENLIKNDSNYLTNLFPVNKPEKWKIIEDLFVRYLFDLLQSRYRSSWYLRSFDMKLPGGYSSFGWPAEIILMDSLDDIEINKSFKTNKFLKVGLFNDLNENNKKLPFDLKIPNGTIIKFKNTKPHINSIFLDNEFVNIEIKFVYSHSIKNIDENISKAYSINISDDNKYMFTPFMIETTTTIKKLRMGHPDMEKYKYWSKDILSFLKNNISIEEFWKQVEQNK